MDSATGSEACPLLRTVIRERCSRWWCLRRTRSSWLDYGLHVVTGKRFFAHHGLVIEKAPTFTAETFEGGIVGFQLAEEPVEAEAKAKKASGGRRSRKAA